MTEVRVTKEPNTEHTETSFGLEAPLSRGGVNPFCSNETLHERDGPDVRVQDSNRAAWRPAIEVKEEKGNLLVTVELAGVKKEDVRVHVRGDALVVERARTSEKEEKREGYFHTELSYGRFYRCGAQE
jgi:HSP20 family molecular chaperone IbpA